MEANKIKLLEFLGTTKRHLIFQYIKEIMTGKKNIAQDCFEILKT